jgi:ribosome-associated protein
MLVISPRVRVPQTEFEFSYARSSGPGGQNVNKVNSKATLRWPMTRSPSLPADVRQRFLARFGNRLTSDGDLLISSQRYRDQPRNTADCLAKLQAMLEAVATPPTPRRKTKPTRASGERRMKAKRVTGEKKQNRRAPRGED